MMKKLYKVLFRTGSLLARSRRASTASSWTRNVTTSSSQCTGPA